MSEKFLKAAVIYLLLGIAVGISMASSHNFADRPLHAHLNLLGWASMAIMALCYRAFPGLAQSPLANAHFWLYNLGAPLTLVGVLAIDHGRMDTGEPLAAIGSMVVAAGIFCFAVNVWRNCGAAQAAAMPEGLALNRR
jgi:cbb3-type cytochrome oxidase subunit 1